MGMDVFEERIRAIFDSAELSESDRSLWMSRLSAAGERAQAVFVESFSDDKELLLFLTRDLRKRIDAGNDPEKLAPILEEEKAYFRDVLNKES